MCVCCVCACVCVHVCACMCVCVRVCVCVLHVPHRPGARAAPRTPPRPHRSRACVHGVCVYARLWARVRAARGRPAHRGRPCRGRTHTHAHTHTHTHAHTHTHTRTRTHTRTVTHTHTHVHTHTHTHTPAPAHACGAPRAAPAAQQQQQADKLRVTPRPSSKRMKSSPGAPARVDVWGKMRERVHEWMLFIF